MRKRILIIEPGGMRIAIVAGIINGLGIKPDEFDEIYTTSSGAVFSVFWIMGIDTLSLWRDKLTKPEFYDPWNPFTRGTWPANLEYFHELFQQQVTPSRLDRLNIRPYLYGSTVDLRDGAVMYRRITGLNTLDMLDGMTSLPITGPKWILNTPVGDGGLVNPIAVRDVWEAHNPPPPRYEKVSLNKEIDFVFVGHRERGWQHPPLNVWNEVLLQTLYPLRFKLHKAVHDRPKHHQRAWAFMNEPPNGATVTVIAPSASVELSRFDRDPERVQAGYDKGVRIGEWASASMVAK